MEEAAEWFMAVGDNLDLDESERVRFVAWLKRSPVHVEEFLQVSALHVQLADVAPNQRQSIQELVDEARSNIVAFDGGAGSDRTERSRFPRGPVKRWRVLAVAASLLVAVIAAFGVFREWAMVGGAQAPTALVYATELGEQRSVVLSDGSVVQLNTQSRLEVKFTKNSRLVLLTRGEAVFDVAKDAARPFRVNAGFAVTEVLGTRFNVYRQAAQTVVTVVEGGVAVSAPHYAGPDGRTAHLTRGHQLAVFANGTVRKNLNADIARATAWMRRRLIFNGDTLAAAVRELNRYNRKHLVIADPKLANRRISGMFDANRPDIVVDFLKNIGGLRVVENVDKSQWLIRSMPGT